MFIFCFIFNSVWLLNKFLTFNARAWSFEVDALFGVETSTLCDAQRGKNDNSEIIGNDIRRKFADTATSPITDILQDDGQIGTTLTTESNQSSRKKVTDTAPSSI